MAARLPSLAELDPVEAWKPWRPDAAQPWSLKWAAHLLRRASFGTPPLTLDATTWQTFLRHLDQSSTIAPPLASSVSTWQRLQWAVGMGLDATFELLCQEGKGQTAYDQVMDSLTPGTNTMYYRPPGGDTPARDLQAWWLHRMAHSGAPLRERLTLFWHGHFATSIAKVRQPGLMIKQNQLFRTHALGKFRPFLLEVSRDPAMLLWLDSNSNVKAKPNENYAREVMELFTLGPGHYSEQDIREAARAFTGWHTTGDRFGRGGPRPFPPQPGMEDSGPAFAFNAAEHDSGPKTVLGQTGPWNGQDVVRILLDQPAAARFLVRKLYREFISEADDPPERVLEPLAEQLRKSDYDIGDLVKTMLRSRLFFSHHAYRRRIKGPVEYVLGLVRGLDAPASPTALVDALEGLGQALFAPPNVRGWEGGRAWLNSLTLVARHNLAWAVLTGGPLPRAMNSPEYYAGNMAEPIRVDIARLVRRHGTQEPEQQVDFLLDLLLQGDCDPAARPKLVEHLKAEAKGDRVRRLKETVHTILTMPEYQLA